MGLPRGAQGHLLSPISGDKESWPNLKVVKTLGNRSPTTLKSWVRRTLARVPTFSHSVKLGGDISPHNSLIVGGGGSDWRLDPRLRIRAGEVSDCGGRKQGTWLASRPALSPLLSLCRPACGGRTGRVPSRRRAARRELHVDLSRRGLAPRPDQLACAPRGAQLRPVEQQQHAERGRRPG